MVDATGDLRKGVHSVGVQRQYPGTTGRIENAQVGVFLAYASRRGHTLIDRRVYLPKSWTEERARCGQAGIPDEIVFATRSQLADDVITAAVAALAPARWVGAGDGHMRLQRQQRSATAKKDMKGSRVAQGHVT